MEVSAPVRTRASDHPDAAEVAGKLVTFPGRRDGQVAPELEDHLLQHMVMVPCPVVRHHLVDRLLRALAAQVDLHTPEQLRVIFHMRGAQVVIGLLCSRVHSLRKRSVQLLRRLAGAVYGILIFIIRIRRVDDGHCIRILHGYRAVCVVRNGSAFVHDLRLHLALHLVIPDLAGKGDLPALCRCRCCQPGGCLYGRCERDLPFLRRGHPGDYRIVRMAGKVFSLIMGSLIVIIHG